MNLVPSNPSVTMTSLELVDYINSQRSEGEAELQHKHFLEKVLKVLGEETSAKFSADLPDSYGRPRKGYKFPKREACLMAMSYSYDIQAKVFDRMTQLAAFYGCSDENIQDNYRNNADRFVEGVHFVKLEGVELKKFRELQPTDSRSQISSMTRSAMIWTEKGAARHAKMK